MLSAALGIETRRENQTAEAPSSPTRPFHSKKSLLREQKWLTVAALGRSQTSFPLLLLWGVFAQHKDKATSPGAEVPARSSAALLMSSTSQKVSSQFPGRSPLVSS